MNNPRLLAGIYLGQMAKRAIRNFVSLSVNIPFLFGAVCVKGGILNLIAPVPGHCLSFYLATRSYGTNVSII